MKNRNEIKSCISTKTIDLGSNKIKIINDEGDVSVIQIEIFNIKIDILRYQRYSMDFSYYSYHILYPYITNAKLVLELKDRIKDLLDFKQGTDVIASSKMVMDNINDANQVLQNFDNIIPIYKDIYSNLENNVILKLSNVDYILAMFEYKQDTIEINTDTFAIYTNSLPLLCRGINSIVTHENMLNDRMYIQVPVNIHNAYEYICNIANVLQKHGVTELILW